MSSTTDQGRYQGKRFAVALVAMILLSAGYVWGPIEVFGAFSTSLALIAGAYMTNQSWSDVRKLTHGNGGGNGQA